MKAIKLFLVILAMTFSIGAILPLSINSPLAKGEQKGVVGSAYFKKADTTKRVWHDGFWWIQTYNDNGDLVYEYIDPVQT
jgi:hypothetical protein